MDTSCTRPVLCWWVPVRVTQRAGEQDDALNIIMGLTLFLAQRMSYTDFPKTNSIAE